MTLPEILTSPEGNGILYFIACALLFVLVGLGWGYLIWKKNVMQVVDLEADNNLSDRALERLTDELKEEEGILERSSGRNA